MRMASSEASESEHDDIPSATSFVDPDADTEGVGAVANEDEGAGALSGDDALEGGEAMETTEEITLVNLCMRVRAVVDLVWRESRARNNQDRRRIYAKFFIEPSNMSVSTKVFFRADTCSVESVRMILPSSLTVQSSKTFLLVEIWEVKSEVHHEFIGHSHRPVHEMVGSSAASYDFILTRKQGKAQCGKVSLTVTLETPTNLLSPALYWEIETHRCLDTVDMRYGCLHVMALECQGLQEICDSAFVSCQHEQSKVWLQSDTGSYDQEQHVLIWNHWFRFDLAVDAMKDGVVLLQVKDEANQLGNDEASALASARLELSAWPKDAVVFCAWMPLHQSWGKEESQPYARIHIACYFVLEEAPTRVEAEFPAERTTSAQRIRNDATQPIDVTKSHRVESPLVMSLGGLLEIRVNRICELSPEAVTSFSTLFTTECESTQRMSVHALLLLEGEASQKTVVAASVSGKADHCSDHQCAVLCTADGGDVVLRFELGPDVTTTALPQVRVELRAKRPQTWRFSISLALPVLLRQLPTGAEYQLRCPLLDQKDRAAGWLDNSFRCGRRDGLESSHHQRIAVKHIPEARTMTLQIMDLQTYSEPNGSSGSFKCFANVWLSSAGKLRAQTVSSLTWGRAIEADRPQKRSCAISLFAHDVATEVVFVAIHRYSARERNAQIALGSFGLCELAMPTDGSSEDTVVEHHVGLFSSVDTGNNLECGRMRLALQLSRVALAEEKIDPRPSFAATGLGEVAYPVQACEMRCRLDVGVIKARSLPSVLKEGDTIIVCLRVAQSKWQTELPGARVVIDGDTGEKVALFGENVHAIIRWSPKDRFIPTLEMSMSGYLRTKSPQNTTRRRSSIAPNARRKFSADLVSHNAASCGTSEERFLVTASVSLCSFFTQPNVWVHSEMEITPGDCHNTTYWIKPNDGSSPASLLTKMRLSSIRDGNTSDAVLTESGNPMVDIINGSVWIHLLHASGSFLGKENPLTEFYVSMVTSSDLATSSSRAVSDARTVTWNEHLALPIHRSVPPIVRLCICRRAMASPDADKLASTGSLRRQMIQHDDDEVVGILSIPIFPSITRSHHLVHFDLPFEASSSRVAKPSDVRVRQGTLSFDMQFLEEQTSIVPADSVQHTVELVIHRLRGDIRESSSGIEYSVMFPKHVIFNVSLMTESNGNENYQSISMTNVVSLSGSGTREIEEVVDITSAAAIAIPGLDSPAVLVVKIRDLDENPCGSVHVPLRSDWKETFVRNKKRTWYSIHDDTSVALADTENKEEAPALLMSIRFDEGSGLEIPSEGVGRFYIKVEEAVPHSSRLGNAKSFWSSAKVGATVVVISDSLSCASGGNKYRTTRSNINESDNSWRWKNGWFGVDDDSHSADALQQLRICLYASEGSKSRRREFTGSMNLVAAMKDATLELVDCWIVLKGPADGEEPAASVHLHLALVYIPTLTGYISMAFSGARAFSESELTPLIEKTFFKCQFCRKSYVTPALEVDDERLDGLEGGHEHNLAVLHIPFDSCLVKTSDGLPSFAIRWMGITKSLGEICLGEFAVSLLSVLNTHTVDLAGRTGQAHSYQKWYTLTDKGDPSRKAGVVCLCTAFKQTANRYGNQSRHGSIAPSKLQAASAEALTVWKKLFYLLDKNSNGYIDQDEFAEAFVRHRDDLLATSDGQQLVQVLFGEHDNDEGSTRVPTAQDVQALFAEIDRNCDNKIEWKEYLQLLQRKQQHRMTTAEQQEGEFNSSPHPEVASPQLEQTIELRKKKREDTYVPLMGIAGRSSSIPNSTTVSVGQTERPRCTRRSVNGSNQDLSPRAEMDAIQAMLEEKSTVKRQLQPTYKSSYRKSFGSKQEFSNEEQRRLRQQVASLESLLVLERQRFAELAADRQALLRSYQKLHLQHQSGTIQDQTKTKWMEQTIERQQQLLEEREVHRRKQNGASVILQSTVRSRLEQRRFQDRKLQRANAAITIQCFARREYAARQLDGLRKADRETKHREMAATKLQWFTRYHVARKERNLLIEVRELSAVILQKYVRRMIAIHGWERQQHSILQLQCWIRQWLAGQRLDRLRDATMSMKSALRVWVLRWQYQRIKAVSVRTQRWWRQVHQDRSVFLQLFEAAICIQSIGRQHLARKQFDRERERQERFLAELEAAVCIQATWRGKHERLLTPRASTPLSGADMDGIEACFSAQKTLENETGYLEPSSSSEPHCEGQDGQQLHLCNTSRGQASSGKSMHATVGDDDEAVFEVAKVLADIIDRLNQQFENTMPHTEERTPSSLSTQRDGDFFFCALEKQLPSIAGPNQSLFEAGRSACGDSMGPLNEPKGVTESSANADATETDLQGEVAGVLESIVTAVLKAAEGICGDPTSQNFDAGEIGEVSKKLNDSDEASGESGRGLAVVVAEFHQDECEGMGDVGTLTKCTEGASNGTTIAGASALEKPEGQHQELAELGDPPSSPTHSRNPTVVSTARDAPESAHDAICSESSEIGHNQVIAAVSNILDEMKVQIEAASSNGDPFDRYGFDVNPESHSLHAEASVHKISVEPTVNAMVAGVPLDRSSDGDSASDSPPADEGPYATETSSATVIYDQSIHCTDTKDHSDSIIDPETLGGEQRLQNQIEVIATKSMAPDQPEIEMGIAEHTMEPCDFEQDAHAEANANLADEEKHNEEENHEAPHHDELGVEDAALVAHSTDKNFAPKDSKPDSGGLESTITSPVYDEIQQSIIESSHHDVPSNEQSANEPVNATKSNAGVVTEIRLSANTASEADNGMTSFKNPAEAEDGEAGSLNFPEGDSALTPSTDGSGDEEEPISASAQFPMAPASSVGDITTSEESAGRGDSTAIRSSEDKVSTTESRPARRRSSANRSDLEDVVGRNSDEGDSGGEDDDDGDSIDSDDLMWEADAMASLDADGGGITSIEHSKRPRRREGRRDSLEMLADLRLLNTQGSTRDSSAPLGSPSENLPATRGSNVNEPDLTIL